MPELAELKIMSDFINKASNGVVFHTIRKSDVSKVKTDLNELGLTEFTVTSKARGKELLIDFYDTTHQKTKSLLMTMGMSGNWTAFTGDPAFHFYAGKMKHAHLSLAGIHPTHGKLTLCMIDVRRFAKWKWTDGFSSNRGPCPVQEHEAFRQNFFAKIGRLPKCLDDKPMLNVIMNQEIFNGIGNYLRAEIFHRANVNPFKSFDDLEDEEIDKVLEYCRICPQEAYVLGGGQLKDWNNSFKVDAASFNEWIKVYSIGESVIDKSGRRFWFDPKWKDSDAHKKY